MFYFLSFPNHKKELFKNSAPQNLNLKKIKRPLFFRKKKHSDRKAFLFWLSSFKL